MAHEINQMTTHELWIESREFQLELARPTPSTIQLTIRRPANPRVLDGAVLTLSTAAITANNYPEDGERFTPSLVWGDPSASTIGGAQVVGFWSGILTQPLPVGTAVGELVEWTVTVTGTDPSTVYYASVHGLTNVLQYYPIGIQSYPLESSRIEKDSSSFTGSIPSYPSAPVNPNPGTVYYDQQLNLVQYWDSTRSVWIPTRTDTITTGPINPGTPGQTYLFSVATQLKVFDGKKWTIASPANLQLAVPGPAWVPLNTVRAATELPDAPTVGDVVYDYTSRRVQYWDGASWQVPTPSSTLFNTGSAIIPAFIGPFTVEPTDLVTPYPGLLFYNTSSRTLNVFNGTSWEQANTSQQGTPTTEKIGVGTDGSYDERLRLIRVLKSQLGYPTQCVELTEDHFNIAIDNALETYRQLSIGAYEMRYMLFTLLNDQQTYYLNSPVEQTDRIVTVHKIHRLNILGANSMNWDTNVYFQTFLSQFYSSGYTDILSIHLMHSLSEEFRRIFAGDMPFVWNEARRELQIARRISRNEKVVLEVELERPEQELLLDRWCKQWLQGWAMAECKEILGLIRSKYSSGTPGPAGTITLNGETLLSEARQDFTDLRQQLFDYEVQNSEHGNVSFLLA